MCFAFLHLVILGYRSHFLALNSCQLLFIDLPTCTDKLQLFLTWAKPQDSHRPPLVNFSRRTPRPLKVSRCRHHRYRYSLGNTMFNLGNRFKLLDNRLSLVSVQSEEGRPHRPQLLTGKVLSLRINLLSLWVPFPLASDAKLGNPLLIN